MHEQGLHTLRFPTWVSSQGFQATPTHPFDLATFLPRVFHRNLSAVWIVYLWDLQVHKDLLAVDLLFLHLPQHLQQSVFHQSVKLFIC